MISQPRHPIPDELCRQLAEAESIDEIKTIRSKAEAFRAYAKSMRLGLQVRNLAAEAKLRAERKAGRLLAGLALRGGDRRSNGCAGRLKLHDLGVTQNQSKRWQREASVPEEAFEEFIEHANRVGVEVSSASLLRLARSFHGNGNLYCAESAYAKGELRIV